MSSPAITDWVADVQARVDPQVEATMDSWWRRLEHVGPEVRDLYDVAAGLLRGGKRLRAAFVAAGWRSLGGAAGAGPEVEAGAGVELFQTAALVHDDIIDASLTRRGIPAAHRQLADLHSQRAMIADPAQFGMAGALLLGDLLLVVADSQLHAALDELPAAARAHGREVVEEMMAEVTVGQYLDIYAQSAPWAQDPAADLDRARRVIRAKSARYSVEHPLTLGATMAGADAAQREGFRAAGLPIGEAFQLRDDVLGVFGDPSVTGKPAGDDLREGKRTVLVTLGMTTATREQREALRAAVGRPDLDADGVAQVRGILTECGALRAVESLITERAAAGMAAIEALGLSKEATGMLSSLAELAISRSA